MLSLDKNPDFDRIETIKVQSHYYDYDPFFERKELWAEHALDASIENYLLTEPGERLFNIGFGSPLIMAIFADLNGAKDILRSACNGIEAIIPVRIHRDKINITHEPGSHVLTIQFTYDSNDGMIRNHTFARRIRR